MSIPFWNFSNIPAECESQFNSYKGGDLVKWLRLLLSFCVVVFVVVGCIKLSPKGDLSLSIEIAAKAIPNSQPVQGTITLEKGSKSLQQDFAFSGSSAQVQFNDLETGIWLISVDLRDSEGYVIYTRESEVEIQAGEQNSAYITLNLTKANLDIYVEVESDEIDEIEIELGTQGSQALNERISVQQRSASFSFQDLDAKVWNVVFKLYDAQDSLIMLCPSSGKYGLELQPGRLNSYHVVIDEFGDITVNVEIQKIEPVTDATLTNISNGIQLSWESSDGAQWYDVYREHDNLWLKLNDSTITELSFVDEDVLENEIYVYRINAGCDSGVQSGFSPEFSLQRDKPRVFVVTKEPMLYQLEVPSLEIESTQELNAQGSFLFSDGRYAYLLNNSGELAVYEVDTLQHVSNTEVSPIAPTSVSFTDEYAFARWINKVAVVRLANPEQQGCLDVGGLGMCSADLYLSVIDTDGVSVFSLQDPLNPERIGSIDLESPDTVFTRQDVFYIHDSGSVKKYKMVENSFVLLDEVVLTEALCIMENEGALYVGQSDGFVVVNFESSTATNFPTGSKVDRMVVDGDVLFVVSGNQLMMYDVSDPFIPNLINAKSFGSDPLNCKGVAAD